MKILDELINQLNQDAPIRNVLVGVHWTVVCSRFCGMASTIVGHSGHDHPVVRDVGYLHEMSARQLAEFARSDNPLEASLGVAAINSLLEVDESHAIEINAREVLIQEGQGKKVAIVGHFPFISTLRQAVGQLWVIEQQPRDGDYPTQSAPEWIPQADIVAITGSALINHTLDDLLDLCQPQSLVMVLGPSTPLSSTLFNHGVHILSGSKIVDEAAVLRTVGQGASFQQVTGVQRLSLWNPACKSP